MEVSQSRPIGQKGQRSAGERSACGPPPHFALCFRALTARIPTSPPAVTPAPRLFCPRAGDPSLHGE